MKVRHDWRRVDGVLTHAAVLGSGEPLVLLPGLGCASWCYGRLARALAPDFEVWCVDPPGHGNSADAPGRFTRLSEVTDHLAAWMTATGLRCATVVGHSMGGEVALDLAARFPGHAARLVLLSPTGLPDTPNVAFQLLRLLVDAPREAPGLVALNAAAYLRCGPARVLALALDQREHLTAPLLPLVGAPVLVLEGVRDPVVPTEALRLLCRLLPRASAALLPGAHAFHFVSAPEVAAHVKAFVRAEPARC